MRALKTLVIVLGALLVLGVAGLGAGITYRIQHPAPVAAPRTTSSPQGALVHITLPEGAKVVGTDLSTGRLVVRVELPDGGVRLYLLDDASGTIVKTIELAPAAK